MADHAKLSPSAADRWFACPGSVVLSQGMPERTSAYADEGTEAHKLGELMLRNLPSISSTSEMRSQVSVYVDNVRDLLEEGCILHVEVRVEVTAGCWGTADAIVWNPTTKTLYVRDLKYGAGVGVEVTDNSQLKIYALAALLTMKYPAEVVNVGVVQPRFNHVEGPVRSKDYDAVDLIEFHGDLMAAVMRVDSATTNGDLYLKHKTNAAAAKQWEDKYLFPTEKGCRWCLASPTCPKVKNKAQEMAKQVFAVATVDNGGVRSYDPADLAKTLDFLPIMEGWIKNVREFAYAEAEKGHAIPDYKLVEKRATRKFKTGIEADLAKALGVPASDLYGPAPLLGLAEIEKMAFGANAAERAKVLEPFVTKESSGHTLVHESDKRPAVSIDAKSAFEVVEADVFS